MRAFVAIFGAVIFCGCDREPIMSPVPVSPVDLRASLPEVRKTNGTMIKDDAGKPRIVYGVTQVELSAEEHKDAEQTSVGLLASQCLRQDLHRCDLDDRTKRPLLYLDSGSAYYRPQWGAIGGYTLAFGMLGGLVGAETYCFVNCGTGGKIALVTVDVVGAVVGTIAVLGFVAAIDHGLNN